MNIGAGVASGIVGLVAGLPAAAVAFAVPAEGRLVVPARWWLGGGVSLAGVAAMVVAAGVAAAGVGVRLGWSLALPVYVLSVVVGAVLAVVDVRRHRLPYVLTVPTAAACLVCFGVASVVADDYAAVMRAVLAGAAAFVGFLLLALAFAGRLGLGDVVLVGWLAMSLGWLGWDRVGLGLLTGLILQALGGVALVARRRTWLADKLPMGPALLVGWLVGVLVTVS
jgi:leader peptidase (prepilin peptidase)/N-methyltransferase